jgi:hypothetical protein
MWGMIVVSILFLMSSDKVKILLVFIGLIGTYVMSMVVPTVNKSVNNLNNNNFIPEYHGKQLGKKR